MSDSEYLVKGMTRWLGGWLAKNWLTTEKQPVKNRDLWEQLAELTRSRTVHWMWIRGHAGHPENERCDRLATEAARQAGRKHVAL
jgi:ribonuclease HI